VRPSIEYTDPLPEQFSIHTTEFLGDITWLAVNCDKSSEAPWNNTISPNATFAILLLNTTFSSVSLIVEVVSDEINSDDEIAILVKWRGLVQLGNFNKIYKHAGTKKAMDYCLDGEFVPYRWWVID
jgi:hypothetical protein